MDHSRHTPAEHELIDETIIQQMIKDTCVEIMPTLIDHYLEESTKRIQKITEAMRQQDLATLEFEAHTLGSSALALGNRILSRHARAIETFCIEGKSQEAWELCSSLPELAQRSFEALNMRKEQGFDE
ncbi:Hpt domain-containing protein [Vibrio sagamiensis]|uniref:Phosphorelay protein n=1 Tax=Vibrio sagamiensis NBRC 104589 TaxID=1219064 RepID=A0A511QDN6_9VIBR